MNFLELTQKLTGPIEERTEKNASMRSDDFGHDCQKLLEFESQALQIAADDVATLLQLVKAQAVALDEAREALQGPANCGNCGGCRDASTRAVSRLIALAQRLEGKGGEG